MGEAGVPALALRVERGRADVEELAAVAVVLCSVLAGRQAAAGAPEPEPGPGPGSSSAVPSWRRPGLVGGQWRSPHCWR
ncbi:acyl-CoA carboxylase epsilon subunit [Streptomyces panaciradicis]|uniref:acyl-CoA carboxylase epsilon subunit n=1 Tax=Streptomyces panaciradicis TaxID=1470261 RepID=UPI00201D1382|nr:acyl-CoA carboxylase epsilon subunit [Streptomyces panaciradicis]MCL6675164.1 acyl-CoA carboxylase subunit epsilon [Streptomyces panaciradicis]